MELSNEFTVGMPPDRAFEVLTDVERIAPCLPGAELQEVKGDEYLGVVKVKVGPITAQYKGVAKFLEKDPVARRAVLRAEGRDTRGQGNASATVTASLEPAGSGTKVRVVTDLTITGKVAQFGRGVLADVSNKLLGQFVQSLEATVADAPAADAAPGVAAAAASSGTATSRGSSRRAGSGAATATPAGSEASPAGNSTGSSGAESNGSRRSPAGAPGGGAAASKPAQAGAKAATSAEAPGSTSSGPATSGPATSASSEPAPTRAPQPSAEPVDLLQLAGGSVLKRVAPIAGVALLLAVLVWLWTRMRGSSES